MGMLGILSWWLFHINYSVRGLLLGQDVCILREGIWRMDAVCSRVFHGIFSLVCDTFSLLLLLLVERMSGMAFQYEKQAASAVWYLLPRVERQWGALSLLMPCPFCPGRSTYWALFSACENYRPTSSRSTGTSGSSQSLQICPENQEW